MSTWFCEDYASWQKGAVKTLTAACDETDQKSEI